MYKFKPEGFFVCQFPVFHGKSTIIYVQQSKLQIS